MRRTRRFAYFACSALGGASLLAPAAAGAAPARDATHAQAAGGPASNFGNLNWVGFNGRGPGVNP